MLNFRRAEHSDVLLYYKWANDPMVRSQSFESDSIPFEQHAKWFSKKLADPECFMLVFFNEVSENVGQVRIEISGAQRAIIGISIDEKFRGKLYGGEMLELSCVFFNELHPAITIDAFIKQENVRSQHVFAKAGFLSRGEVQYNGFNSYHYTKYENR
jgi:RimJ/RimL family protein N-acetyltransferase